ncbi:hypothetical protein [Azohydromonas aeria]|uniref:hypothetical protein n=1 Tax=Azohydromonas aeria TaxID=2590212 RepID=UPI0012FC66E1|nr:hypothetical protein [Azohydromonas aeria]
MSGAPAPRPMRSAATWLAFVNEHRPCPAKGVTPWFACSVRPARIGWYERQFTDGIYRQWWNGVAWLFGPDKNQHWRQVDSYPCWRGLNKPAK